MYKFTFTNSNGESLYFAYNTPFVLESVSGLSDISAYTQTEKVPFQDGSSYIDTLLNARTMAFTVQIRSNIETNRRKAIRVLNPKLKTGTLKFTKDDINYYYLECVVDDAPNFLEEHENRRSKMQRFMFTIEANKPYWTDTYQTFTLASFVGGFSFPISFPLSFGTVGSTLTLDNTGDIETPVFITMNGPLTNPTLTNVTTGDYITLAQDLPSGYSLEINTAVGNKTITIIDDLGNRSNGFAYVSPDSILFDLAIGENEITYVADFQPNDVAVSIMFRNKYVGI